MAEHGASDCAALDDEAALLGMYARCVAEWRELSEVPSGNRFWCLGEEYRREDRTPTGTARAVLSLSDGAMRAAWERMRLEREWTVREIRAGIKRAGWKAPEWPEGFPVEASNG